MSLRTSADSAEDGCIFAQRQKISIPALTQSTLEYVDSGGECE